MMAATLWRQEFGDSWDIPDAITQDPRLQDTSWGNDACPSFAFVDADWDHDDPARLWVEHPQPSRRELGGPRFVVTTGPDCDTAYAGDDVTAALATLMGTKAAAVAHVRRRPRGGA